MISLSQNHSITQFQRLIKDIYSLPDDRNFSIYDLLSNQERFTMRAIKGIRKKDKIKLKSNLLIAFSWLTAISNRLHIDLEKSLWRRFPRLCSYCGQKPCVCKAKRLKRRIKITRRGTDKPETLAEFQTMFGEIYPVQTRTLTDAGVHLAEETGEVSEVIYIYLGQHKTIQFRSIENELADWISCMFGVANSAQINVSQELQKMYSRNCHVCHHVPCTCNFSFVAQFRS